MNTKLILAVLLVALIGVVAGTYQVTNNADTTNTFTPVETEDLDDSEIDSATDAVGSGSSGSDSVNTNTASSSKVPTSSANAKNKIATSTSTSSSSQSASSSQSTSAKVSNKNNSANNANIQAQLLPKAISQSRNIGGDGAYLAYSGNVNGVKYYTYALTKNGEVIGEAEYNQYGKLTGGAFVGEVDPPADNNDTAEE